MYLFSPIKLISVSSLYTGSLQNRRRGTRSVLDSAGEMNDAAVTVIDGTQQAQDDETKRLSDFAGIDDAQQPQEDVPPAPAVIDAPSSSTQQELSQELSAMLLDPHFVAILNDTSALLNSPSVPSALNTGFCACRACQAALQEGMQRPPPSRYVSLGGPPSGPFSTMRFREHRDVSSGPLECQGAAGKAQGAEQDPPSPPSSHDPGHS